MNDDAKIEALRAQVTALSQIVAGLLRDGVTRSEIGAHVQDALPSFMQGLNSRPATGTTLKLGAGGLAYWGGSEEGKKSEGIEAKGTDGLYRALLRREFDENGDIVPIGSETWPTLDPGHTLEWCIDDIRGTAL